MPDTKTIHVRVTFTIPIEVPADWDDERARLNIEANTDPGTGYVGAAIEELIEQHNDAGTCWGCAYNGENRIVEPRPDLTRLLGS